MFKPAKTTTILPTALVKQIMKRRKITEVSILPDGFIKTWQRHAGWRDQYGSFDKSIRDAAAAQLYDALSTSEREELKTLGQITIKCASGHRVIIRPIYAGTTNVGCFSIGTRAQHKSEFYQSHQHTTIGGFLLNLKIRFSLECLCRGNFNWDKERLGDENWEKQRSGDE